MRFRRLVTLLLILVLGESACGGSHPTAMPRPRKEQGFNLLIVAEGGVQLKRDGWIDFHPTSFGAALYRGDQLHPAAEAKVVVLCDNLTVWMVPSGAPSGLTNGCPQIPEPGLVRGESVIGNTRGATNPLIPYIISPRATKLLSPTPTLRWNPVPGVKSYSVRISGLDWQDMVNGTEVIYPGDPPLLPGTTYLLIVESDNGKSSQSEGVPGLGFSLPLEEETRRIRADITTIAGLKLSDDAEAFALAQLYAGRGMYSEAINMLEELADADSQAANVYRALGDHYQQIGLPLLAEQSYLETVKIVESADDPEVLAEAQARLGTVYLTLGNKVEAIHWLKQAKLGYEALGDEKKVEEVQNQLMNLSP